MSARDTTESDARVARWVERHRWSHRCPDCHRCHGHVSGCPSDLDADATGVTGVPYPDENDSPEDLT